MNWTIESEVAVTLVPVVLLLLIAAGIALIWNGWHDSYEGGILMFFGAMCILGVLVGAFGLWWGMYPWKAEYHSWRPVSGTVAQIDSRLISDGSGRVDQKFVVSFVGDPTQYGVIDTRGAAVKVGDHLDISCVKRWQQTGSHGYDCAFTDLRKAQS